MKHIAILAASAALLSACSDSGSADTDNDGTVSNAEIAAAAKAGGVTRPDPGQYRSTVEILEFDVPGMPEEVKTMMATKMSGFTTEHCMTEEDADQGFEKMAKESQQGDCTFSRFDVNGGNIDAQMNCKAGPDSDMSITMSGTGSATSSEMIMKSEGSMPGLGAAKMTMKVKNERIGPCA